MLNGEKLLKDVQSLCEHEGFDGTDDILDEFVDIYDENESLRKRKKKMTNLLYRLVVLFGVKKLCSLFVSFIIDIVEDGESRVQFKDKTVRFFMENNKMEIEEVEEEGD